MSQMGLPLQGRSEVAGCGIVVTRVMHYAGNFGRTIRLNVFLNTKIAPVNERQPLNGTGNASPVFG